MCRYLNLSQRRCQAISGLAFGKQGRLYLRFIAVVAILAAAIYAYSAFASAPTATPAIINANATRIPNASIARVNDQLFFASNYSDADLNPEENSTFKWLK